MKIVIQGVHCKTKAFNLIVNVTVHCRRTSTTLLLWQIAKIDPPTATFRSFFNDNIATKMALGRYDGRNRALSQVFVGKIKELDLVDPDLVAVEATSTFSPYIKYYLGADDESRETTQASSSCASGPRNAFHILLQAQATYFVFEKTTQFEPESSKWERETFMLLKVAIGCNNE